MKILFNSLIMVLAAGIGLVAGLVWRDRSGDALPPSESRATNAAAADVPKAKRFSAAPTPTRAHAVDDSPLATQLERDLSMSSGVTRWLYWLEAMEKAAPGDFPRLLRLANGDAAATRLVAACWADRDPRGAFDALMGPMGKLPGFPADQLARTLFDVWPKRDMEAAIAALNESRNRSWRMHAINFIFDADAERGLCLMSEWALNNYAPNMKSLPGWTAANPRHAAEFIMQHNAGYASTRAIEAVGKEWAKTDPARALEFAATRPGDLGYKLEAAVIKDWAARDLNQAAQWLAGMDKATRDRLSPTFVEAWAKKDPTSALAWCEANLVGRAQVNAVGSTIAGAAAKDIGNAAKLVTAMEPSRARAEAAGAVAEKWFPDPFSPKSVPPDAIQWLGTLDNDSVIRALERIQWNWLEIDPQGMAGFLKASSNRDIPAHVYSMMGWRLGRKDPLMALAWAEQVPAEHRTTVGQSAFNAWQDSQPAAAGKWLDELPASDPRRKSLMEAAARLKTK